ncbi:MAG: prolyl oligopeptidase family serine peptidase [bacterium]|nr:prolyl oligopeptidase family serine peptidase [bacterium]
MKISKRVFFVIILVLIPLTVFSQGKLEDYKRADELREKVRGKVSNLIIQSDWIGKSNMLWYSRRVKDGKAFMLVNAEERSRKKAFDHKKLAEALSEKTGKDYSEKTLPFDRITFKNENKTVTFVADTFNWTCDLETYDLKKGKRREPRRRRPYDWSMNEKLEFNKPVKSPDKKWEAYIRDYNLFLRSRETDEVFQLTDDGANISFYSSRIFWSPDSKKLTTDLVKPAVEWEIHYVESSPDDQFRPKHTTMTYPKPGDVLPIRKPKLFNVETKEQINVDDSLFENPYGISRAVWRKNSSAFTFEFNQRGHQVFRVIEVNANTGYVRPLIDEQCETFFHYSGKKYRHDINDGEEIIWMSERDGWNHLYLYDGNTGRVKNQITKGEWVVRRVVDVDDDSRTITFQASGMESGRDPYLIDYFRINYDGAGLVKLTDGNGNHTADFSSGKEFFTDMYSNVDTPPVFVLRRSSDGKVVMDLEKADIRDLERTGWTAPEVFVAKGRDNVTDIWGIIIRPMNFDKNKEYPVIEYIYAGPHNSFAPKTFAVYRSMQALAELGFIVVQMDGMGTSNRSKAFHDVCWQNLGDAGFPDRILWMKAAAEKYDYMDITKVGIYGTSAGGQSSTGAVLFHPEFYKVAVSSCGCHDNRVDKIWWNEQWMGYPIGQHYAASSNIDNAYRLEGRLLLILGEMDTNVDPASTLMVVDALIKANKDFDFLMVPGMGHSGGGMYGERKRRDYFVKHLLGVDPPEWNAITDEGKR